MPPDLETHIAGFDEAAIVQAARLIAAGELVGIATETVYGLAADATNADAVARIYRAKGRPSFNPLIVHLPSIDAARTVAKLSPRLLALAEQHWPGPLTIVAPLREGSAIASLVTAGLQTIAVRVPAHPAIRALLEACGRPLAAPSANASGSISPTRAEHVMRTLGGRISLIVDAGPCPGGIESTIVGEINGQLRLLRRGPIDIPGAQAGDDGAIRAPGQLASHYAPSKPLRLDAERAAAGEYFIGFGGIDGESNLSPSGDLVEAAARLFDLLHRADQSDSSNIAVAPVPNFGLGAAINDRLRRAAAPG